MCNEEKKDEVTEETKGPGGSALGDTLRAVDDLDIDDPEEIQMIYQMLNGGE